MVGAVLLVFSGFFHVFLFCLSSICGLCPMLHVGLDVPFFDYHFNSLRVSLTLIVLRIFILNQVCSILNL